MAERKSKEEKDPPKFTELNDLCSERNGGAVLFATDDWFAVAENLIKAEEPKWLEGVFTDYGKWMDGWETRRKRIPGHDWGIIRLGVPGVIHGVTVDTSFFTGNYTPQFSLQAAYLNSKDEENIPHRRSEMGSAATVSMLEKVGKLQSENWTVLVPMSKLEGGYKDTRYNYFPVTNQMPWTHIRLNMYPDGGIARLRIYGETKRDWDKVGPNELLDLVSMCNGGICVGYSDAHYGHPRNIIQPGISINMGDGWETARRLDRPCVLEADENGILQVPGCEWAMFQLGHIGIIKQVEVDTMHFKGNFPDIIRIEGLLVKHSKTWTADEKSEWRTILPAQKLSPNKSHTYSGNHILDKGPVSHVRVTIAPDGGISRMRLWGYCDAGP